VLWLSWPAVRNSWAVFEGSPDPGGLPRYPIRAAILVGFGLLLLQGLARVPKLVAQWRRGGRSGQDEPAGPPEAVQ
jgi:TRAP-type mannitol/chloroaromatic compound transport system permease small subunit